ncbi:MAG: AI-2E family transporter [Bdellovibrio sp.]|nr:AI-2E family transporter [Bdellovibrio sp.]
MKKPADLHFQRDMLKLACLFGALAGVAAIFAISPSLSTPCALALVVALLLSPAVAALEGRGYSRLAASLMVFGGLIAVLAAMSVWGIQAALSDWGDFSEKMPLYFQGSIVKMRSLEALAKERFAFLSNSHITDSVLRWGSKTGQWFVDEGPVIMSRIVGWIFIVPLLTLMILNEGPNLRRQFYQLVPNRYFESFFLISTDIFRGISDYLRAKLLEALLICFLTSLALMIARAPYAIVFGILAGITNIIPYVGPFIGAVPAIIIASFDSPDPKMVYTVAAIFVAVNIIDMVVIFPMVVAKLVNLHPLILIAAVGIGQRYYGLVGMLISVPIATALKVIFLEIYSSVYEYCPNTSMSGTGDDGLSASDDERAA